jgi:lipopolysaccharide transport system ATP-binding protein
MSSNKIAIKVSNLSKRYTIGLKKDSSLRGTLAKMLSFKKSGDKDKFWALNDLNFEINQGDVIGVIGKNGAGKSTLLKVLSQITSPTTGRIEINGRVASLLEVGTGFHPELTGRENIYLNGTILGMTRKEVKLKFDEIVEFSGVEKFIDTPVKRYSSGMYVRLAFSVAAHLEPEILIIDEVLAVGDAEFQKKCMGKMKDVAGQGRTVIFVSHDIAAVRSLCSQTIFLSKGEIVEYGETSKVITSYLSSGNEDGAYVPQKIKPDIEIAFKKIEVVTIDDTPSSTFECSDEVKIKFHFEVRNESHPYTLFVIIKNQYGAPVFSAETKPDKDELSLIIDSKSLTRGSYCIHAFIHLPKIKQVDIAEDVCSFKIADLTSEFANHGTYNYGSVFGRYTWI